MQVKSDACGTAVGAVVKQLNGFFWHPVEYFSKRLNNTESMYSTIEHEIIGLYFSNGAMASMLSW